MAEGGEPMVKVEAFYLTKNYGTKDHAYILYQGSMIKYEDENEGLAVYRVHTPSGIKEIKYNDLNVYLKNVIYSANSCYVEYNYVEI